ncbi:hypothetical protein [Mycobacteroides abscessus]|uniref:hypothetical protein n=1 Tax=Mycobacteroides abscessus TaxID=36809 RepID=UPI000C2594EE|nr:hypothetical protein [Mycobacteroides abscessus]
MHPALEEILAGVEEIEAAAEAGTRRARAFRFAKGFYFNEREDPAVTALVIQGKLAQLTIHDAVCKWPLEDAVATINAVVINAFLEWRQDFDIRAGVSQ